MTAAAFPKGRQVFHGGVLPAVVLLAVAGAAAVPLVWGFARMPERAFHAYLAAYAWVLSIVLGCVAFVMIWHAANATWPVAVRRLPEAIGSTMPWVALLFIPIVVGLRPLYPWTRPEEFSEHVQHAFHHRAPFLNTPGFVTRAGVYLGAWSLLGWLLHRGSIAMELHGDAGGRARRLRRLSYAGLPVSALFAGFAAYEWFMALSPEFYSTMFAALWIAICLHAGIAATVLVVALARRSRVGPTVLASHAYALGRLLFAFLIFFAYTAFFQYLLVWMANRPAEAEWYLARSRGHYSWEGWFIVLGEFALPFLVLLSYRVKQATRRLAPIAVYCLLALYVHIHWLITPAARGDGWSWLDPIALIVVGSSVAACVFLQLRGRPLAPVGDPRYAASLDYHSR